MYREIGCVNLLRYSQICSISNIYGDEVIDLSSMVDSRYSIPPDAILPEPPNSQRLDTTVEVINETTLMTARRLVQAGRKPLVLNFANGTHVGGGFLTGARAQEETLCYASTLYSTLVGDPMYAYNLKTNEMESTDYMILSQAVVFRDDDYNLIPSPWVMDVVTATAPIAQSRWGGVSRARSGSDARSDRKVVRCCTRIWIHRSCLGGLGLWRIWK